MRTESRSKNNEVLDSINDDRGFLSDSNITIKKQGSLSKWTNYIKGYRIRWFVLDSQGTLSYYRSKNDVGVSCRGSINLQDSRIIVDKVANTLTISGISQSFHLKANNEIDRTNWLTALENAREYANQRADENKALITNKEDLEKLLSDAKSTLNKKLEDLCSTETQITKLTGELSRLKTDDKSLSDKLKLLKTNTDSLIQISESLVVMAKKEIQNMSDLVANEHNQRLLLQEQIETLAKQHSNLERAAFRSATTSIEQPPYVEGGEDEDEFHDAQEGPENDDMDEYDLTVITGGDSSSRHDSLTDDTDSSSHQFSGHMIKTDLMSNDSLNDFLFSTSNREIRKRRTKIPDRPQCSINLWSIMRNCIGKELTKIPMPVNFNEPLSFLQRITEDLEYADLLDRAAELSDSCEQMCYVAAYATSCYSTTGNRTTKPFNPLLGETYECDRIADRGWRSLTEQVSHHPPSTAHHAEGRKWIMYQDFTMTSRFRGKYLSVSPTGYTHVKFKNSGNHYTYKKITTTVHNIIVGKLWIDNHGEMQIENHTTGDKCQFKFHAYSYFAPDKARKITGVVKDKKGNARRVIQGHWDKSIEIAKVLRHDKNNLETANYERIWTINPAYENSENMYRFTKLAIELNEEEEGVAPTDSRNRMDQRIMEQGDFEKANIIKEELEEKQRKKRRQREAEVESLIQQGLSYTEYEPVWFTKTQDDFTGSVIHVIKDNEYWSCKDKQEWSRCPSIF